MSLMLGKILFCLFLEHFQEDTAKVTVFLTYVERPYIKFENVRTNSRCKPMFPIKMISIYDRILADKEITDNPVESWNAR